MTPVENEFREKGIVDAGLLMLRPAVAIEMVRRCRELAIPVEVVEGFLIRDDGRLQVSMDDTLGLGRASSNITDESNCWNLADKFLFTYLCRPVLFNLTVPTAECF